MIMNFHLMQYFYLIMLIWTQIRDNVVTYDRSLLSVRKLSMLSVLQNGFIVFPSA